MFFQKIEPESQKLRLRTEKLQQLEVALPIVDDAKRELEQMNVSTFCDISILHVLFTSLSKQN